MTEHYNESRINNSYRLENPKNDIEFDKIVKFLNAQKAVIDYADLN